MVPKVFLTFENTEIVYFWLCFLEMSTEIFSAVFPEIWTRIRASPEYVKCPKKDSVIKVSLESDLLFSVEI